MTKKYNNYYKVAGFIGSSLAKKFIKNGYKVIGIDNLNDYYDVNLKIARLNIISPGYDRFNSFWNFHRLSINYDQLNNIFEMAGENLIVVNLAAQAELDILLKIQIHIYKVI